MIIIIKLMQQKTHDSKSHSHVIGHKNYISKSQLAARLSNQTETLIQKLEKEQQWNLSSKKVPFDVIVEVFEKVKEKLEQKQQESPVKRLYLHWNQQPQVVQIIISHPLPNLILLNIGGNNIESLQQLQRTDFKNLQQLWLWFNRLVRVDSLRKCHFPTLKYLDLSDNHIQECPKITEMYAPALQRINIEKNGFTHLKDFTKKIIASHNQFLLLFMDNKIVKAFNQRHRKGSKTINSLLNKMELKKHIRFFFKCEAVAHAIIIRHVQQLHF